jgi:hypothetical protein
MKAITLVEIELPICSLTYGVAPCTAAGSEKCFNSRRTCQDGVNFAVSTVTLRFAIDNGLLPREIEAIPSVLDVSLVAAQIAPGEGLGVRASCNVSFADHPFADTAKGFDKYLADRGYDPFRQGTFWAKMRARHPYLKGQGLRIIRGFAPEFISQAYPFGEPLPDGVLDDQEARTYIIDSFDGARDDLTFQVTGKDILKIADGDRALAPKPSNGRLNADIAIDASELTLSPGGVGNAEYPTTGHVTIGGGEVVSFARDTYAGLSSDTQLLYRFDGANNSTTITDSSGKGRTGAAFGNARLSTADKAFGTAACIFDGTGDFIRVADNDAWALGGTANFTIDAQIKVSSLAINRMIVCHGDTNTGWYFYVSTTGVLSFVLASGGSPVFTLASAAAAIAINTRYHVAAERTGNTWRLYIDGVVVATTTNSATVGNYSTFLYIGSQSNESAWQFAGWIDELRIQSAATWSGAFTPPVAPYMASTDSLSIIRAQLGTVARAHAAQDRVQLMLTYDAQDPADVIYDLLATYADGDISLLDLDQWKGETGVYLNQVISAHIAEPTAVRKLIEEITRQCQLVIWQDELTQKVNLRVLRPVQSNAVVYDQDDYLANSLQSREQPDKRRSQIFTFFAQRDPTKKIDDNDNFRSADLRIDTDSELNYGPAIEQIFSRWFPQGARAVVEQMADNIVSRYKDAPRRFSLELFKTTAKKPAQAMTCFVSARSLQDATGALENVPCIVTRIESTATSYKVEAEEVRGGAEPQDLVNRVIYVEDVLYNVNLRDLHDSIYAPITPTDVANGVNLTLRILEGRKIGSTHASLPALDIGTWIDDDFPIVIELAGKVQGRGGDGANGLQNNALTNDPAKDGHDGGTAIFTRRPITITGDGDIWGGGGGGATAWSLNGYSGPGGGGAGLNGGDGGTGYTASYDAQDGTETAGGTHGLPAGNADKGGDGGGPGLAGLRTTPFNLQAMYYGFGGDPGAAIDGDSYVTIADSPDIRGPQIN